MEMTRVLELIQIFLIYSVSILGVGEIISRSFTRGKGISYRFLMNLVVGNFYVINMAFVLAYLKLWYRPVLVIVLLGVACAIRFFLDKERVVPFWKNIYEWMVLVLKGEVGHKNALKIMGTNARMHFHARFQRLFKDKSVELLFLLFILGVNLYYYSYQAFHFVSYAAPDVEVHLGWIQSLVGGELFPRGVYPFGMHCVGAVLCTVWGIPAVTFARMFGVVTTLYIIFAGYLFVREICKHRYAPILGFTIFTIGNIMVGTSYTRYSAMIAQEYAMIFLCPMMLFLYRYLNEKKKTDLVLFGMCVSLTLAIHFYITAIAFFFCLAVGVVYLVRIIKQKMLVPILVCGISSILIAVLPLAIGLLLGYELEQSFTYGASVVTGDATMYMDTSEYTEEELEEMASESIYGFRVEKPYRVSNILETGGGLLEKYVFKDVASLWIFILPMIAIVVNWVIRIFKKKVTDQEMIYLSLLVYTLILFEQTLGSIFDWLVFIEPKRMAIFLCYVMPALIAIMIDIVYVVTAKEKKTKCVWEVLVLACAVIFTTYTYAGNAQRPMPNIYYFQTTGAMKAACDIINHYEDDTWTIVSPVNEVSVVENHGYHYEIKDFVGQMENYKEGMEFYIPTEYVFFFVEKMPIEWYGWEFEITDPALRERTVVYQEAVFDDIPNLYSEGNTCYSESRMQLMSRMYYWAQEYMQYFSDEMSVFYEDDEFVVYRLKQDPYALNNLVIDYKEGLVNE